MIDGSVFLESALQGNLPESIEESEFNLERMVQIPVANID